MKRKSMIITMALLLVFSTAFAQMWGGARNTGTKAGFMSENYRILTDDERDKIADSKRDFEKVAIPLRADIRVLRLELDELLVAGKTGKELTSKLDDFNAAKAKLSEERLDHQVEVRKIVGEDKYKEMHMQKRHMMHNKMGGRGSKKGGRMNSRPNQGDCRYPDGPRYK